MESSSSEEVIRLRQEYLILQRHLQSGQQRLRSRVQRLKAASDNRATKPRLTQQYQTKTSTPKTIDRKHRGRVLRKRVTSKRTTYHHLGRFQSNSDLKTPHRANTISSPRIPLFSTTSTSEAESEELPSSSEVNQLQNINTDNGHRNLNSLENSRCSRSPRKYPRSKGKENSRKTGQNILIHDKRSIVRDGVNCRQEELDSDTSPNYEDNREIHKESTVDVTPLPKSILLAPGIKQRAKTPGRVAFVKRLNQPSAKKKDILTKDRSMLGYDWIAGVLETDSQQASQSDQFFDEICQFRRTHRGQCVHESVSDVDLLQTDSIVEESLEVRDDIGINYQHKCVHNYTVNERLFPVPLHEARSGESLCAVCQSRKDPSATENSPSYIRVSIPRSTLVSPYRVKYHRRRSFDPTESLGLSKHCLSGWQCSKPSMMPTAKSLDIKSSFGSTTLRSNSNLLKENLPLKDQRIVRMSTRTQELLDRSIVLQLHGRQPTGLSNGKQLY